MRPVLTVALLLISAGSALSVTMTATWQLVLLWGVLVGVGTGSISMGFVATIATRWFDEPTRPRHRRAHGGPARRSQLIFLPVIAEVTMRHGWRWASIIVAVAAVSVVPLVLVFLRNYPKDFGLIAYGASEATGGNTAASEATGGNTAASEATGGNTAASEATGGNTAVSEATGGSFRAAFDGLRIGRPGAGVLATR